jgi:hypothetical protein
LVVLILVNGSLYKKWISDAGVAHNKTLAIQVAKSDLLASEIAWLDNIPDTNIVSEAVQLRTASDTMMMFARDMKLKQANFGITITKLAVAGEASNSIVEINNRVTQINGVRYVPVDFMGNYTMITDLQAFSDWLIQQGMLVRKLKINDSYNFEMVLFMPVEDAHV